MSGFKLYRSRIILALSSRAYKNTLKVSSQASTEPEIAEQQTYKQLKLNNETSIKINNHNNQQSQIQLKETQESTLIKNILPSQQQNQSKIEITQQVRQYLKQPTNSQSQQAHKSDNIAQNQKKNQEQGIDNKTQLIEQKLKSIVLQKQTEQLPIIQPGSKKEVKYFKSCGLHNIGNTCYFNSALQCVINTPKFNDQFLSDEIKYQLNPKHKQVAVQYWKLLKKVRVPQSNSENPSQLKQAISSSTRKFNGHRQEDSQEFLRALLTCLHEDLNRVTGKPIYKELSADITKQTLQEISTTWFNYFKGRDDSIVTDYFSGQLLSRVTCSVCKNQSLAFDNFQDLSLAFPNSSGKQFSLEEMLKYYLSEEQINSYTCGKCRQQRRCTRQLEIWRLPDMLVLHLKRFQYNGPMRKKITSDVKFGAHLDLNQFVKNKSDKSTENCQYSLYGIVKHYGDLNFGHYFAECKHPFTNKWYQLNDSSVSEIKSKSGYESDNSAYLLFYSRI